MSNYTVRGGLIRVKGSCDRFDGRDCTIDRSRFTQDGTPIHPGDPDDNPYEAHQCGIDRGPRDLGLAGLCSAWFFVGLVLLGSGFCGTLSPGLGEQIPVAFVASGVSVIVSSVLFFRHANRPS